MLTSRRPPFLVTDFFGFLDCLVDECVVRVEEFSRIVPGSNFNAFSVADEAEEQAVSEFLACRTFIPVEVLLPLFPNFVRKLAAASDGRFPLQTFKHKNNHPSRRFAVDSFQFLVELISHIVVQSKGWILDEGLVLMV